MCDEVLFRGRYLHTVEDLQAVIGAGEIVPKYQCGYNKNDLLPHCCLCPVDLERTAAKNGLHLYPPHNGKSVWMLEE